MIRVATIFLAFIPLLVPPLERLTAADLRRSSGQVILTIVGDINYTNRGTHSADEDLFFRFHEKKFQRAAEFDLQSLKAMGLQAEK